MNTGIKKNKFHNIFLSILLFLLTTCTEKKYYDIVLIDEMEDGGLSYSKYDENEKNQEDNRSAHYDSIPVSPDSEFEQILIGLDNEKGVPFYYEEIYGYVIEGFDVDEEGKFYFLAGNDSSTLVCFLGDKEIFRRNFNQFSGNAIRIYENQILIFDKNYNENNLFVINKQDGRLIKSFPRIIENHVSNNYFLDSSLIVRVFNLEEKITLDTELAYLEYDFEGGLIGSVSNIYNLPNDLYSSIPYTEFLGYWKNNLVFYKYDIDIDYSYEGFFIQDSNRNVLETKMYDANIFGENIYGLGGGAQGGPLEHLRLKNNNIYYLKRKGKHAVINMIPLQELFPNF